MRSLITRSGLVIATTTFVISLAACAAPASESATPSTTSTSPQSSEKPAAAPSDDDYAFGTDRDQIAKAIEAAFASEKGQARWEGDTFVLSVAEGDANDDLAGFTQCRVLMHILNENDVSIIEFPNGQVACADALADE